MLMPMLHTCRLQNKLRLFKLLTLQDGYAYLPTDDYQEIIARITQSQQVPNFFFLPLLCQVPHYSLLKSCRKMAAGKV